MKNLSILIFLCCALSFRIVAQNTGIGTTTPQAKLDVNGTFRLQQGVTVNEISTDTTFAAASDQILPTQLAVKKYLQHGAWVPEFQVTDTTQVLRDSISHQGTLTWAQLQGNFVYAIEAGFGLKIYDISNPDSIILRGSTNTNINSPVRVAVQGDYAYVTSFGNNQLNIYNISDPDNIVALGTTSQNLAGPYNIFVEGNYAYVTSYNNDQVCIFNISNPNAISVESSITHSAMDGPTSLWKQGSYLWVTSQFGSGTGYLHRFLVSNPAAPVLKGYSNINLNKPNSVRTSGSVAWVTSQLNHSLVAFDGTDPNQITPLSVFNHGLSSPNNLSIGGRYAWVTSAQPASDIVQIDISDPSNPSLRPLVLDGYSNINAAVFAYAPYLLIAGSSSHTLWLFEHTPLEDCRRVSIGTNGSFRFDVGAWKTGHQLNETTNPNNYKVYDFEIIANEGRRIIYRTEGKVGIGTSTPLSKLHLIGDQKFYGGYGQYLEFGAGIPGKDINAGKFSYNSGLSGNQSYDVFNIIGGGSPGHRKMKFWADETIITGPMYTQDTIRLFGDASYKGASMEKQVGLFMEPDVVAHDISCVLNQPPGAITYKNFLTMRGVMRIMDNGQESGLYFRPWQGSNSESVFIGMKDGQLFGIRRSDQEWPLQIHTGNGHIGMFRTPHASYRLFVEGNLNIGGDVVVNGETRAYTPTISSVLKLETGVGTPNKHPESGLMYRNNQQQFTISGAGTDILSRRIKLWAEGGLEMTGDFEVAATLNADAIATPAWEDLSAFFQNGWVDYGNGFVEAAYYKDPAGVVHLRGLITGGLNQQNTVIFTLPPTHRPSYGHMIFAVVNGVDTLGRIDIESDGDVVFRGSTNTFLSLDQIQFRTF